MCNFFHCMCVLDLGLHLHAVYTNYKWLKCITDHCPGGITLCWKLSRHLIGWKTSESAKKHFSTCVIN